MSKLSQSIKLLSNTATAVGDVFGDPRPFVVVTLDGDGFPMTVDSPLADVSPEARRLIAAALRAQADKWDGRAQAKRSENERMAKIAMGKKPSA